MRSELHRLLLAKYPHSKISFFNFGLSTPKFRVNDLLLRIHTDLEVFHIEASVLHLLSRKTSSFQLQGSQTFYCIELDWIPGQVLSNLDNILSIWSNWKEFTSELTLDRSHQELVTNFFSSYHGGLRPLIDNLLNNWPVAPSQLIHGDFHRENIIHTEIDNEDAFVLIDFEFACMGDPHFDLIYCMVYDLILFIYSSQTSAIHAVDLFESRYRSILNQVPHDIPLEKFWLTLSFLINAVWFINCKDPLGKFIVQIMKDFDIGSINSSFS